VIGAVIHPVGDSPAENGLRVNLLLCALQDFQLSNNTCAIMQQANESLRCLEPCTFRPPALRRVPPCRGGSLRPHATISQAPLTVATTRGLAAALHGGLAKWQWPAVLATGELCKHLRQLMSLIIYRLSAEGIQAG
jgi:hypothetical protein